jgi:hypothetical protein
LIWPNTGSKIVLLGMFAQVILLSCKSRVLPGWRCVPEGRPGAELLHLVQREGLLTL